MTRRTGLGLGAALIAVYLATAVAGGLLLHQASALPEYRDPDRRS